ncbi:hypothetical protein NADFUDRAFT_41881 [Nadsonia fulvescens var. elongata DSM 6958]|uniref:K Homology domain-containing protein n=1 Tax=Nadsonia fulvescens var. elongata DSM 6958 TaxID=857566 RepID=A0A1E3PLS5_9ASCO|nr:hypothetical protein NADFUDRAFT_41881 [Nadsonia fulvescens var. elongata DSM 6958]
MSIKRSVPGSPSHDSLDLPEAKRRAVGEQDKKIKYESQSTLVSEALVDDTIEGNEEAEQATKEGSEHTSNKISVYQVRLLVFSSLKNFIASKSSLFEDGHAVNIKVVEGSTQSIDDVLIVSADAKGKIGSACREILQAVLNVSAIGAKGPTARILINSRAIAGYDSRKSIIDKLKTFDPLATISKSCLPGSIDKVITLHSDNFNNIKQLIEVISEFTSLKDVDFNNIRTHFVPKTVTGIMGNPATFTRQKINEPLASRNPYIIYELIARPGMPLVSPASSTESTQPSTDESMQGVVEDRAHEEAQRTTQVDEEITQQIFIPSDMVGNVIGKQGSNITEIRNKSGSFVQVFQPQDDSKERRVTVTGTKAGNKIALAMLFKKLETEKAHYQRLKRGG